MTMPVESSGALCAAIVPQCAVALIFADREGRIQLWNDAAVRLIAFTAEQAIGRSLDIVIPEHLRARHWAGYRVAMLSGATKHSGSPMLTKGLHRSGVTLYAEMGFAVAQAPRRGILGSIAVAREPRERLATEKVEAFSASFLLARSHGDMPVVSGPGCAQRRTR